MAKITLQQAIQYASAAGFNLNNGIDTILAIAMAESGLNTDAYNSAVQATGILQIALLYHPDVTKAQALDPAFSFRYAYKLSGGGKNFCPWQSYDCKICGNCGKNGWDNRYKQFLPAVQAALQGSTLSSASAVTTMVSNVVSTTPQRKSFRHQMFLCSALDIQICRHMSQRIIGYVLISSHGGRISDIFFFFFLNDNDSHLDCFPYFSSL